MLTLSVDKYQFIEPQSHSFPLWSRTAFSQFHKDINNNSVLFCTVKNEGRFRVETFLPLFLPAIEIYSKDVIAGPADLNQTLRKCSSQSSVILLAHAADF